MSWWDDNTPQTQTLQTAVGQLYQTLLGRAASPAEIQGWIDGTQGNLQAIQQGIAGSPEAAAYQSQAATRTTPPTAAGDPAGGGTGTQGGSTAPAAAGGPSGDPQSWLLQQLNAGVDPQTAINQLNAAGGQYAALAADYYASKGAGVVGLAGGSYLAKNADGSWGYNVGDSGGAATTTQPTPSAIPSAPTASSYTPPSAPAYTPYNPGPAPTPTPFVAPTATDAQNSPGYQAAIATANQGIQRSDVAKSGIGGATLKDIGTYDIGLADQNYQNVFGNALTANEANNGQALNAYTAGANANIGAGNLNLAGTNSQFTNTYQPSLQSYLSNVAQQQFGANYGLAANNQGFGQNLATNQFNLGAQGQYFNQGLASNENAYNQYNTSQNAAFNQWLQTAQLGNPGNPYT